MIEEKVYQQGGNKCSLLISTFFLAVFIIIALNIIMILVYIIQHIEQPDFDRLTLAFKNNRLIINDEKVGFSIIQNGSVFLFVWLFLIIATVRAVNKKMTTYFL